MMLTSALRAAALAATILLELPTTGIAHDGAHKEWLKSLVRPDNSPARPEVRSSVAGKPTSSIQNSKSKTQADPTRRIDGTLGCMTLGL